MQRRAGRTSRNLLRFVADTVLLEGFGFDPPGRDPDARRLAGSRARDAGRPLVGVVFYRAHLVAGNTQFVDDLCDAHRGRGAPTSVAVWCYSLRGDAARPVLDLLARPRRRRADHDGAGRRRRRPPAPASPAEPAASTATTWDASALGRARRARSSRRRRRASRSPSGRTTDGGLGPYDATAGVAIPEFDGRIIGPAFAFNEVVDDGDELGSVVRGLPHRARPGRARSPASPLRYARLRRTPPGRAAGRHRAQSPTRPSAAGSATPSASTRRRRRIALLARAARPPATASTDIPADGDALMAELADGLTYDAEHAHRRRSWRRPSAASPSTDYSRLVRRPCPPTRASELERRVGPGAGHASASTTATSCSAASTSATCSWPSSRRVATATTRSAVYHSPNLPPAHHYLAFYRWLDEVLGRRRHRPPRQARHARVAAGQGAGAVGRRAGPTPPSATCPFFYPFVVNDPGEGTQAKRRAHAVVIDHLLPPMTRADTYDETGPARAALRRVRQIQSARPVEAAGPARADLGDCSPTPPSTATSASATRPTPTTSTT